MKKPVVTLLLALISFNVMAVRTTASAPSAQHKTHKKQPTKAKAKSKTTTKSKTAAKTKAKPKTRVHHDAIMAAAAGSSVVAANKTQARTTPATKRIPKLYSYSALVVDTRNDETIISKNADVSLPIASITKLMTAMVLLDANPDLDAYITISDADVDRLRNTYSRLKVGMQLRRRDLLLLALMSSENRAAHALARTAYPGGLNEFIRRMNVKAKSLGMNNTQFYNPTGLTAQNKSTAADLAKMVKAAYQYSLIREDSTTKSADVILSPRYTHRYINSDALVRGDRFTIELSKTGFINESGHCLVLYAMVDNRPIIMIFLNSNGKSGRLVDAMAVRNYIDRMQ